MKKIILTLALASFLFSCKTATTNASKQNDVEVTIDLVNVKEDKVMVSILAPTFTTETATFNIPMILKKVVVLAKVMMCFLLLEQTLMQEKTSC